MEPLTRSLAEALVVLTATMGGVFYAFSSFIMPALNRLPTVDAVRAMSTINRSAVRPPFMLPLFGTAIISVALIFVGSGSLPLLAGSSFYLIGVIGVTLFVHVPRNNALEHATSERPGAATEAWSRFYAPWCRWNHARWIASIASSVILLLGTL